MVIPPFEFEVSTEEDISRAVQMELTIHDPAGGTHIQRFSHHNMWERCGAHCLPVRSPNDCGPRRCRMERFWPRAQRIDHTVYRGNIPGIWTFVLRRLDNDDRVSVAVRLFEGAALDGAEGPAVCEALPLTLGGFRRVSCRRAIVPLASRTSHWGLRARYIGGSCPVNVFALPLNQAVRTVFHEGPYAAGAERSLPGGIVREIQIEGVTARAWLAHYHLYVLTAQADLPGFDAVTGGLLEVFPVVDGPVRDIPSCEATGAVTTRTVPPVTMDALQADHPFRIHFEGNRPSGAVVRMNDRHPLALAGLRRHEIVQTVNGERVNDRRELLAALEGMTRPGRMEIVVSRSHMRHARCIELTIDASAVAALEEPIVRVRPPLPPRPQPPRRGRHCERHSDQCWDCVEFPFPAELGCSSNCRGDQICVHFGGRDQCLASTRVCCQTASCNIPPGCDGAASSCGAAVAGRNDRCTFLSDCPAPLPSL